MDMSGAPVGAPMTGVTSLPPSLEMIYGTLRNICPGGTSVLPAGRPIRLGLEGGFCILRLTTLRYGGKIYMHYIVAYKSIVYLYVENIFGI